MGREKSRVVLEASIFKIIMLLCFGAAWPFSIHKSYAFRSNAGKGKSFLFLAVLLIGYAAGAIHKVLDGFDSVIRCGDVHSAPYLRVSANGRSFAAAKLPSQNASDMERCAAPC